MWRVDKKEQNKCLYISHKEVRLQLIPCYIPLICFFFHLQTKTWFLTKYTNTSTQWLKKWMKHAKQRKIRQKYCSVTGKIMPFNHYSLKKEKHANFTGFSAYNHGETSKVSGIHTKIYSSKRPVSILLKIVNREYIFGLLTVMKLMRNQSFRGKL